SHSVSDLDPVETSPFMSRKYAEELVAAHPGQLELVPDGDPPAGADFVSPDVFDFLFGSRWKRATLAHAIPEVITGGAPSKDEHTLKGLISNSARPEIVRRMMKSTRDFQDKDKVKALFDRLASGGIPCPASRPPRVNDPKQWGELKPGTPQYKRKIAILKRNLFPRRKSQNYDSGLTTSVLNLSYLQSETCARPGFEDERSLGVGLSRIFFLYNRALLRYKQKVLHRRAR